MHRLAGAGVRARDHQLVDQLVDGHAFGNVFRAGTVVGEEEDDGVLELPVAAQRFDDAPDALVHPVDLRRIDLHAAQQPRLVLGLGPGRLAGITLGELPGGVEQSGLHQLLEPLGAQVVPALVEAALVAGDVVFMRVQRPVRRGVGDVGEEGRVGGFLLVLVDERHRLIADGIGVEERRVGLGLVLDVLVAAGQRVGVVEAAGADDRAVELVEAALQRPGVGGSG